MANDKPKRNGKLNARYLTVEQKRKICEWKLESPAKSLRTLAEEASTEFGRKLTFQSVSRVLKQKNEIMGQKSKPSSSDIRLTQANTN